jgi:hypothetical protein
MAGKFKKKKKKAIGVNILNKKELILVILKISVLISPMTSMTRMPRLSNHLKRRLNLYIM